MRQVAHVRFRDLVARRKFLRRLRKHMRAKGLAPSYVDRWVKDHFGAGTVVSTPRVLTHVDHCADVALEVSGVTCWVEED